MGSWFRSFLLSEQFQVTGLGAYLLMIPNESSATKQALLEK